MKILPFFIFLLLMASCGINQEEAQQKAQIAFEHYMDSLNNAIIAKAKYEQDSIANATLEAFKADSIRQAFVKDSLRKVWLWRQKQKLTEAQEQTTQTTPNE